MLTPDDPSQADPHLVDVAVTGGQAGTSPAEPRDSRVRRARHGAPLPVAASVAAVWAATVSYVPLLILVLAGSWGSGTPVTGAARLTGAGWLLAHGVPVETPADRVTLLPLAVTAVVFWRLTRAGVHASRAIGAHRARSAGRVLGAGLAVGLGYAVVGGIVARLVRTDDLQVSPWRATATLGLFGAAAAAMGGLTHSRSGRRLLAMAPEVLRDAVRTGTAAAAMVVAAGAAAAGVALAIHGGAGAEMLASYQAGVLGQAGITALCLVYLPNAAVWAAAYLLGPGFSIGTDSVVSPGEVILGSVPGLPVLAGLPSAPLTGAGPTLLGVPLLAGVAAGWLLARRRSGRPWSAVLGAAALAGPVGGVMVYGACVAASGSLGSGRLAAIGTSDWRVGVFAAFVVGLGALIGAMPIARSAWPRAASPRDF